MNACNESIYTSNKKFSNKLSRNVGTLVSVSYLRQIICHSMTQNSHIAFISFSITQTLYIHFNLNIHTLSYILCESLDTFWKVEAGSSTKNSQYPFRPPSQTHASKQIRYPHNSLFTIVFRVNLVLLSGWLTGWLVS